MAVQSHRYLLAAMAVAGLGTFASAPRTARADEASCIAASESEVLLREQNKLRAAIDQLLVCAAPGCPEEVRTECNRRLVARNAALPTLVLRATDSAGNNLLAVKVTLDGAPFASALDGRALPIDPGSHVLRLETVGKPPVEKTILIAEGEKARRVVVVIADAPGTAATPARAAVVGSPATPSIMPSPQPEPQGAGGTRTVGFVVGGVGVASLVAGGIFGGLALSTSSTAKGECNGPGGSCTGNTSAAATNDSHTAGTYASVSTGTFLAGGALVAAGVVLVLVGAPKKAQTAVQWSPAVLAHGGGLGLSGSW